MAEIRLKIDEDFIEGLKKDSGIEKVSQLTNDALLVYQWLVSEVKNGRVFITANENGSDPKKVVFPAFEKIRNKK